MNQSPPPPQKKDPSVLMKSSESPALKTPSPPGRGMDIGIGPQEGHSISVTSACGKESLVGDLLGDPYIGLWK